MMYPYVLSFCHLTLKPTSFSLPVFQSIVGVAGGATRAALTQHQARRDNMADVAAKDGSQETLVNLMALLAGLVITPLVSGNTMLTWTLFFIFTFLHIYSNFRAVSAVVMETLNITRLQIVMQEYLFTERILTPEEVACREPVLFGSVQDFQSALPDSRNTRYIMRVNLNISASKGTASIVLHESADVIDHVKSCFQAVVMDFVIRTKVIRQMDITSSRPGSQALVALHNFWWQG
ncbi:hypothetical protein QZH41_012810, partial [Actinostola sp. cb2023]